MDRPALDYAAQPRIPIGRFFPTHARLAIRTDSQTRGEGDGSLAYWCAAHRAYFNGVYARLGGEVDETIPVICPSFLLLWTT